ncbi:MAG: hypothetical protein ACSLE6_03180 [Mycobacterium sp.]
MANFRQSRSRLFAAFTASVAIAAFFASASPASAFYIQNHESITRAALPADQVSQSAIAQILVGPPPGAGVVGSDAFFADNFRHLDNATNPAEVCTLATQAWNTFAPVILNGSQLINGELADGPAARAAFGGLLHVQQDFYAHSNFVDINVAEGQPDRLAPAIFPTCDPAALPAGLYTGYFDVTANHDDPLAGCPASGPPPGFAECHSTLNKDGPSTPRGSAAATPTQTMYDVAAMLATQASTDLYYQARTAVAAANGEEAAAMLFQGSGQVTAPVAVVTDPGAGK